VHIRALRNWGILLFIPLWLSGWTYGGIVAISSLISHPESFLAFWLVGWLFGEVFAALAWLWAAFGKEVVLIQQGTLTISKRIGGVQLARRYPLHEVRNIRASGWYGSPTSFSESLRPWGLSGGTVAFDHQGKPVRFGIGLSEEEAREVATELAPYLSAAA
jgi:hypothetical protein